MATQVIEPRRIADGLIFGEGIRWKGDKIVLSDMLDQKVIEFDPNDGSRRTLLDLDVRPNGLVVREDGSIIVLTLPGKVLVLQEDGSTTELADVTPIVTGYLGDVVQHADGTIFLDDVGTRVLHGAEPAPIGKVIAIRTDGSYEPVLTDINFPNGIVISPDGKTLYLAKTRSEPPSIVAYDIAPGPRLENERVLAALETPIDGMTIDDEGGIWACILVSGLGVGRFDQGGELTHRVDIPGYEPVACSIGGPDGRTMCITAIESIHGKNIFEEMIAKRVRSSVFVAEVPFEKKLARP